jgi:hypothetical protein
MKQKVWVVNTTYPIVFKDDTFVEADFTKNKRNMKLDTYTRIFTDEEGVKSYTANNQDHNYKFVSVCEDEIDVNVNGINRENSSEVSKETNSEVNNEVKSDTNNSRLLPGYKDHLFAVIELAEFKEQTNGSVTAIFVSEENAKKYADELLEHLNEEKHRTVVKSYRVLVQPIPKKDIEKPGVNTPVTDGWYLPPKK